MSKETPYSISKEDYELLQSIKNVASKLISKPTEDKKKLPVTERIKSVEDALEDLGSKISPERLTLIKYAGDDNYMTGKAFQARAEVVIEALNEGHIFDWNNSNEEKWYIWWNMSGGFSFYIVDHYFTISRTPSRLCFKTEALARYFAATFPELTKGYMLNQG